MREKRFRLMPGDPPGRVQNRPFRATCPPGRYAHCQCQQSAKFPYCDGGHRALDGSAANGLPQRPVKVNLAETTTVDWCACGKSGGMPFCDGSHNGGQA